MLLSAVIATKNSARTIGRCLDSVLAYRQQGYIEDIVVVDGHSTDATAEIAQRYPVLLLREKGMERYQESMILTHFSTYAALDQGWRASRGDLVMFLDSNAYLGKGFFPTALDFFADKKLGVLGCWAKAWVTAPHTRTVGQLWDFHGERIRWLQDGATSPSLLQRFYRSITFPGATKLLVTGPCYVARRECMELLGGHGVLGDAGLSLRLQQVDWRSWWWVDAPVYHLPKENLGAMLRQRYLWGKMWAITPGDGMGRLFTLGLRPVAATALGLFLAVRYRNLRQLVTLPLGEAALLGGYIYGVVKRLQGAT